MVALNAADARYKDGEGPSRASGRWAPCAPTSPPSCTPPATATSTPTRSARARNRSCGGSAATAGKNGKPASPAAPTAPADAHPAQNAAERRNGRVALPASPRLTPPTDGHPPAGDGASHPRRPERCHLKPHAATRPTTAFRRREVRSRCRLAQLGFVRGRSERRLGGDACSTVRAAT